jgi:hypothetical protein
MKTKTFVSGIILAAFFLAGCVSDINNTRLNIRVDNIQQAEILPLTGSNNELTLYHIGSQVMEQSGFLNREGQGYGYYAVSVKNTRDKAPNFFICGWVNGLTLFTLSLLGIPTDLEEFGVTAFLYIFDSAGTMIKVYRDSDTFTKLAGLYYGQDPNKKASRYYSALFKGLLEQANRQSAEINYLLRAAGPVTNENMQAAQTKLTEFFSKNNVHSR